MSVVCATQPQECRVWRYCNGALLVLVTLERLRRGGSLILTPALLERRPFHPVPEGSREGGCHCPQQVIGSRSPLAA
ncbi:hypothetical protein E2C01_074180 [Portunus trituberculatus]|uniref:Uncharacterized protein n=1 Tax=Portunus trituberculatus TaxID=210409 RepID=A0A5B7IBG9_PORTR|nr:hypothetical protein [Portunus trituberculatus]